MIGKTRGKQLRDYVADYVVFDLETTGTSPRYDAIIEISAVKVIDGRVVDTFSTLVNPDRPIPYGASAVNHITDDMVADAPYIDEVLPLFLDFIGDYVLVGHNIANFDMKYIWREVSEMYGSVAITITNDYIDTLPMARNILPELAHHRLVDIAAHYDISTQGAHRALNDCIINQQCFQLLNSEQNIGIPKKCPQCGKIMKKRNGIYGEFWGCSGFPNCRHTENC
jgi:DNA polymerase III epsilon subunit family exonuclease